MTAEANNNNMTPTRPIPDASLQIKMKGHPEKRSQEAFALAKRKLDFSEIAPQTNIYVPMETDGCVIDPEFKGYNPSENLTAKTRDNESVESGDNLDFVMDENFSDRERIIVLKSAKYNFDFKSGRPFTEEQCSELLGAEGAKYEWTKTDGNHQDNK